MKNKSWLFIFCLCIFSVFFLTHFSINLFKREFIDHDDYRFIQSLLDLGLVHYFKEGFWNRENYSYFLRDLSFFGDFYVGQYLSQWIQIKTFWFTQFILFCIYLFLLIKLIQKFSFAPLIQFSLFCFLAFHPYNTEILLWAYNRKYSLSILLHLWFLLVYLSAKTNSHTLSKSKSKSMIKQTAITPKTWVYLGVLWVVALLCYSNAILWMPVVLWLERKNWSSALPRWSAVFSGTIFVAIGYFAFTVFGASGYQTGLQSFGNAQNLPRIVIYTVLSLGRGFLNTLLPYKLAAYYSETSWLNVIGVILFFLSIALFLKVKRRVAFDSAVNSPAGLVFILGVATLIPSFFVINTVESFVWADRYGYSVLAFFAISGASIFQLGQSKKFSAVLICLTLTFPFVIYKNVPLWRDAPTLMKSCALGENSTKCTISFLERVFKTLPCPQYFDVLQNGRRLYAEKQYFYDAEFESDMPFFDSICTGTTFIGNTIDINKQILELNSVYGGVGHVSLAQVLQELQMKNPGPAYEVAKSSYLVSGLEKPNITMLSEKSNNYYLGHIDALCVFAKNPDCLERKKIFVKNFTVQQNQEYYSLGFQQTFSALNGPMMFK